MWNNTNPVIIIIFTFGLPKKLISKYVLYPLYY